MTTYYVDSAASGGGETGADWANAYLTIEDALEGGSVAAGDIVLVDDGHSHNYGAAVTLTSPGTMIAPVFIISVDKADDSYSQGASEEATGSTYTFTITGGSIVSFGVDYTAGGHLDFGQANSVFHFKDCSLKIGNNSTAGYTLKPDGNYSHYRFENVNLKFTGSGQYIAVAAGEHVELVDCTVVADSTAPNILFDNLGNGTQLTIRDCDLSAVPNYIIGGSSVNASLINIEGCLLNATVGFLENTPYAASDAGTRAIMRDCDDAAGDLQVRFEEYYCEGSIVQETSIYLNWKYDGTNYASVKMVTTAAALEFILPLRFKLAEFWATANPTITVELVLDSATALNKDDFWIEIEYPDSTNPTHRQIDRTSRPDSEFDSPTSLTASSVSWTGTGGMSNEQKRKVEETISGGAAGPHTVWVCYAKPDGGTPLPIYVDPEVTVS